MNGNLDLFVLRNYNFRFYNDVFQYNKEDLNRLRT